MGKKYDNKIAKGRREKVEPIKNDRDLKLVEDTLLNNFTLGLRNLTLFKLGVVTMLRASDLVNLKVGDVYDADGYPKGESSVMEKKTGKTKYIFPSKIEGDLVKYMKWRRKMGVISDFLFVNKNGNPLSPHQVWRVMNRVGELNGLDYLGSHTMRKTGAYQVYRQTGNIALVMELLNHSSEKMTLRYLGIDKQEQKSVLGKINFFGDK